MTTHTERQIVIIGGGIVGCTTAYYLSRHPEFSPSTTITLLEASKNGVAQGASGKAGGLVAKWAYPREIVDVSFEEHVKLAEEHGGKDRWGWRFVGCGSWEGQGELIGGDAGSGVGKGGERKSLEKTNGLDDLRKDAEKAKKRTEKGLPSDLLWVKEELTHTYSPMAGDGATAQVHPYLFTTSMLELAKEKGVQFIQGRATSINRSDGDITGVTYTAAGKEEVIPATHVVLAAGAWSPSLVPSLRIVGTRAHSITIRPPAGSVISPYVLFTEIELTSSRAARRPKITTPEIYARPDNEVYICGPGDNSRLPAVVDDVEVDESACEAIRQQVASISEELRNGNVEKRQACFLPVVASGAGPIIGEARKIARGLYIATGHTCWGICNAPGTGKILAELIMDGKIRSANLRSLDPSNYL